MIILHLLAALLSIASTTLLFFRPSKAQFNASYALIGLTLASGTYLTIAAPAHLLEACTMGLLYLGGVATALIVARLRFARKHIDNQ